MKIYIAAPFPMRAQANEVRVWVESLGHVVTSRWLTEEQTGMSHEHATGDLADVYEADVLLALNPPGWEEKGTGGRHVELGFALAHEKRCILVGARSNNFHHLDTVEVVQSVEDILW